MASGWHRLSHTVVAVGGGRNTGEYSVWGKKCFKQSSAVKYFYLNLCVAWLCDLPKKDNSTVQISTVSQGGHTSLMMCTMSELNQS